jgi:hypothetical protein
VTRSAHHSNGKLNSQLGISEITLINRCTGIFWSRYLYTCMQAQPWVLLPLGLPPSAQRRDPIIPKNSLNSIQTRIIIRPNRHLFKPRLPAYSACVGISEGKSILGACWYDIELVPDKSKYKALQKCHEGEMTRRNATYTQHGDAGTPQSVSQHYPGLAYSWLQWWDVLLGRGRYKRQPY